MLQDTLFEAFVPYIKQKKILYQLTHPNMEAHKTEYLLRSPNKIVIVGCGGTGGWFMPKLVKIINESVAKFLFSLPLEIILVDADVVETKNLARQNFISADIARNKAEVMCDRYSQHLVPNVTMHYVDKYISASDVIDALPEVARSNFCTIDQIIGDDPTWVFSFIDNALTRKIIHRYAAKFPNVYVFDVANNQYNGQLTFSHYPQEFPAVYYRVGKPLEYKNMMSNMYPYFNNSISSFLIRYPHHLDDNEYVKLHNCADEDMNAVSQLFNANDMAATLTATLLTNCLEKGSIQYSEYKFYTGQNISIEATRPIISLYGDLEADALHSWASENASFTNLLNQNPSLYQAHQTFDFPYLLFNQSIGHYIDELKKENTPSSVEVDLDTQQSDE